MARNLFAGHVFFQTPYPVETNLSAAFMFVRYVYGALTP